MLPWPWPKRAASDRGKATASNIPHSMQPVTVAVASARCILSALSPSSPSKTPPRHKKPQRKHQQHPPQYPARSSGGSHCPLCTVADVSREYRHRRTDTHTSTHQEGSRSHPMAPTVMATAPRSARQTKIVTTAACMQPVTVAVASARCILPWPHSKARQIAPTNTRNSIQPVTVVVATTCCTLPQPHPRKKPPVQPQIVGSIKEIPISIAHPIENRRPHHHAIRQRSQYATNQHA